MDNRIPAEKLKAIPPREPHRNERREQARMFGAIMNTITMRLHDVGHRQKAQMDW